MAAQLVVQVLAALLGPKPLQTTAMLIRDWSHADRVSITQIDGDRYEMKAHSGAELLPVGAGFTLDTSTHFSSAADGRDFECIDFVADEKFSLPLDSLVLSAGFRSGFSVPITVSDDVVGALSLSSADYGWELSPHQRIELDSAAALIAGHLADEAWAGPLSVLIAHRDPLVAAGIRDVLSDQISARATVVGSPALLIAALETTKPHVVVMGEGFDQSLTGTAEAIRTTRTFAPLVFLSPQDGPFARLRAGQAGAAAFISHDQAHPQLSKAIVTLLRKRELAPEYRPTDPDTIEQPRLTKREQELLHGLERGQTLRDIATDLRVSETTLKGYARDLYAKLGAHSRGEAVHFAREHGLLG